MSAEQQGAMVLGRATLRSAKLLGLCSADLARTIDLDEVTVSLVQMGVVGISLRTRAGQLALQFVCICRLLDEQVGGSDIERKLWMRSHIDELGGTPQELIASAAGLAKTLAFLSGLRQVV